MSGVLITGPHVADVHRRNGMLVLREAREKGKGFNKARRIREAAFCLDDQGSLEYAGEYTLGWAIWCAHELDAQS